MPYKEKGKQMESQRDRVRRYRERQKALQGSADVTPEVNPDVTPLVETVPASYIVGNQGRYEFLPERPCFLTLRDGQVYDRSYQPAADKGLKGMRACNDAYFSEMQGEMAPFLKLKEKYSDAIK